LKMLQYINGVSIIMKQEIIRIFGILKYKI